MGFLLGELRAGGLPLLLGLNTHVGLVLILYATSFYIFVPTFRASLQEFLLGKDVADWGDFAR